MKDKNIEEFPSLSPQMAGPEEIARLKKRAQDLGLIAYAGVGKIGFPTGKRAEKK